MDDPNVVAARLGLPFKCGVCTKVHEKADLNVKDLHKCYGRVWHYVLDRNPDSYVGGITRTDWELTGLDYFFNTRTIIHYWYPIENDVFMLAFQTMWKCVDKLRKKFEDWKDDCLKQGIRLIEEKGELNEVRIISRQLVINGFIHESITYRLALLMMKHKDVAIDLAWISRYPMLDVEWKSLKESAKLLIETWYSGHMCTMLVSERTGVVQVPNGISSIREAENFLRKTGPAE